MSDKPTLGRIVFMRLSSEQKSDAESRRISADDVQRNIRDGKWPLGAQSHVGNNVPDVVPMIVTAVHPDLFGPGNDGVNGQAFLDGNDTLWIIKAAEGVGPGQWSWPVRP